MGRASSLLLLVAFGVGCGGALFSRLSARTHDAYDTESFARLQQVQARGVASKADVLATLGPPDHVIGQADGEIFVYRRVALDTYVINVNPGVVSGLGPTPAIPLYLRSRTAGRDDTLMIFLDAAGRVRGQGARHGIDGAFEEAGE